MGEIQSIQWFPGHMAKTRRKIQEDLKLVDVVAEILDARVPRAAPTPCCGTLFSESPRWFYSIKATWQTPLKPLNGSPITPLKEKRPSLLRVKREKASTLFILPSARF